MVSGGYGFTEGTKPAAVAGVSVAYADVADHRVKAVAPDGSVSMLSNADLDRNYLMNGGFDIAQRQVPTTLTNYATTADRTYAFDRWGLSIQTGNLQAQQVDTIGTIVAGITASNYAKFKQIGAPSSGKFILSQVIEGRDGAPLRGRTVRFQFKARYAIAASMIVRFSIIELAAAATVDTVTNPWTTAWGVSTTDPIWGANLAHVAPVLLDNCTLVNSRAQCTLTAAFQRFSATFTLPNNSKNYIVAIWSDSLIASNDEFHITEAGLYDSETPKDWMIITPDQLLQTCQRFYEKSFPALVLPAASVAEAGNSPIYGVIGKAGAVALACQIPVRFLIPKRIATPTVTLFTPTAAGAVPFRLSGTTPAAQTAVAQVGLSDLGFNCTATGDANGAVGDRVGVHFTASAEI